MNETILLVGLALAFKHFWIDSPFQTPYQYLNKGTLGHPGGLLHAFLHGAATFVIFSFVDYDLAMLGILDFILHYFIDFSKVNIDKKYKFSYRTDNELRIISPWYFHMLILDQCLHFATYVFFLAMIP